MLPRAAVWARIMLSARGVVKAGPSPSGLGETHLFQLGVRQAEEVAGLVQQRDPHLLGQLVGVGHRPLQVAPEQHDLRQPGLTAQANPASGCAVPENSPNARGSSPASTSASAG